MIYTKSGDNGITYCRENRISKDSLIINTIGDLDELGSILGICKYYIKEDKNLYLFIKDIQSDLLKIGIRNKY